MVTLSGRRAVRIVLALGILIGVSNGVTFAQSQPEQIGIATDVYYHAAEVALDGGDFYAVTPPDHGGFYFLYPPVVMALFLPYGLLGEPGLAYAVQTALNLLTALGFGAVMVATVERGIGRLPWLDRLLIGGYALGSAHVTSALVMGQVNLQLALALAAGTLALERGREAAAGALFAGAALVKLFPALVGAWLLRRRAWRAILAAVGAGVGLLALGVVVFGPGIAETYVTETLSRELSVATFEDGPDPESPYLTVRRQLSVLAPWLPAGWLLPAAVAVLAPVVLASYRTLHDRTSRLVALQATLLATLVCFPLETFYLALAIFPAIPLLYLLDPGAPRALWLVGVLVLSAPVWLSTVEMWTGIVPLPPGAETAVMDAARAVFTFAMPTMAGVWALLAACVLYQHRAVRELRSGAESEVSVAGPDADPPT